MKAEKFQDLQGESIGRLQPQEKPMFQFESKDRKRAKFQFKAGQAGRILYYSGPSAFLFSSDLQLIA